jgi:hypothetical protein
MSTLVTAITDQLAKLATQGSAAQIRDFLYAEKIKGIRGSARFCPVACYLRREVSETEVSVSRTYTMCWETPFCVESVPTPSVVRDFTLLFDKGAYPELETLA